MSRRRHRSRGPLYGLLRMALPEEAVDPVLGDLDEEMAALRRRGVGPLRRTLWMVRESLSLTVAFALDRMRDHGREARRAKTPPLSGIGLSGDLRVALRRIVASPASTAVTVVTLGTGLAMTAVKLAVLHAAWVQPVSYPDADALVDILATRTDRPGSRAGISPADFVALRDGTDAFEAFGAYVPFGSFELTGDGDPALLRRFLVTADFFSALAVPPLLGRTFREAEENPGADHVVVLSWQLWQGRFGGRRNVVGEHLRLDGESYTVVGVMPRDFGARGGQPDLWAPLSFGPHRPQDRTTGYLGGIGRLRSGATLERARAQLDAICLRLAEELPETNATRRMSALPLRRVLTDGLRPTLSLLLAAVLLVLLVAVANVAGLSFSQGLLRREELTLRRVVGASRSAIARLVLLESLVLTVLAGFLGTVVAAAGIRLVPDLHGQVLHDWVELRLDRAVLVLTWGLVLAVGAVLGLLAGRQAAKIASERPGQKDQLGARHAPGSLPDTVVLVQSAACLLLLLGAGLALRSVAHLQGVDLGYRPDRIVSAGLFFPASRYPSGEAVTSLVKELTEGIAGLDGIEAAGVSSSDPGGGWSFRPSLEGDPNPPQVSARWLMVDRGFFRTLGIPIVEGRGFEGRDRVGSPLVMVVNRAAARALAPESDVVGLRFEFARDELWHQVVGVVGDVLADPASPAVPACYLLLEQHPQLIDEANLRQVRLLVRTSDRDQTLDRILPGIRTRLAAFDPELPLTGAAYLDESLQRSIFRPRIGSLLLGVFAAFALLLAALGLYGLLTFSVRQRRFELGLRLALGATPHGLMARVVGRGLALTAGGLVLGLLAWLPLRRLVGSLVHGVGTGDPLILGLAPAVLLATALLAAWLPARRVARLDPAVSLRYE